MHERPSAHEGRPPRPRGATGHRSRQDTRDIRALQDGLQAVADGDRAVRLRAIADDDLGELARVANRMIERLADDEARWETAFAAHHDLVASASHDLKTPLAALSVLAEAIRDEVGDVHARDRYVGQLATQVQILGVMVDDLFELSRLQAGDLAWVPQRVRLGELIDESLEAMRPHAEHKRVVLASRVPDDLPPAHAHPEKVQRVLFNLLGNAIRHTPANGTVTVATEATAAVLETEVADTGEGVDPAVRDRVFEPFFRTGGSSSGAAGLGLAICRAIIEAHGERIWLAGAGPGTRVRFSLRRAEAPEVDLTAR